MTDTQLFDTSILQPKTSMGQFAVKDDDDDDDDNDDDSVTRDSQIFGTTSVFIEGRSTFTRTESTTLGSLTADANLFVAKTVDTSVSISITSATSITNSIGFVGDDDTLFPTQANPSSGKKQGEISRLDIENALSLNNGLGITVADSPTTGANYRIWHFDIKFRRVINSLSPYQRSII